MKLLWKILIALATTRFLLAIDDDHLVKIGKSSISKIDHENNHVPNNYFGCQFHLPNDYTDLEDYFTKKGNQESLDGYLLEEDIYQALVLCKVLVIRDQSNLSIDNQRALTRHFGALQVRIRLIINRSYMNLLSIFLGASGK